MKTLLVVSAVFLAMGIAGCGGSGSTPNPPDETATLTMSITQSDTGELTDLSAKSLGNLPASKSVVMTDYSISCRDSAGNEYTSTIGAADADGKSAASVPNIPIGTPIVCYLLDSTGAVVTQLIVSDANVFGGQYDALKLLANATNTVVFNPLVNGAFMTPDANTSASLTPSTTVDPTGSYAMTCVGAFNEQTGAENAEYTATYCANFVSSGKTNVYLHRIDVTQGSNTVYGMGIWRNQDAFSLCGSTEAIDRLPSGTTLPDGSTQGTPFSWYGDASFSESSTTDEIAQMIRSFGNHASGVSPTYDAYMAAGSCDWLNHLSPSVSEDQWTAMCASQYYWEVVHVYITANPASYCIPNLNSFWTTENEHTPQVALSARREPASTTYALNSYDFMPMQFVADASGNPAGRMSGKRFWVYYVYQPTEDGSHGTLINCLKTASIIVQFPIPSTAPVVGTQITADVNAETTVASEHGTLEDTLLCEQSGGRGSWMAPNGYVLRVVMTKQ